MNSVVRLLPRGQRPQPAPSLVAAWVVAGSIAVALLFAAATPAAELVIVTPWDLRTPAGFGVWVVLGGLIWAALTVLLEAVKSRWGPRALSITAVGVLALMLGTPLFQVATSSPEFAEAAANTPLSVRLLGAILAIAFGAAGAVVSVTGLMTVSAVEVGVPSRLARSVVLSIGILGALFAIAAHGFPEGVNATFAESAWLPLLVLSLIGFIVTKTARWATSEVPRGASEASRLGSRDALMALLPLVPVVRYLVVNREAMTTLALLIVLAAFTAVSLVMVIAIPSGLARWSDRRVVQASISGWLFVLLNMAALSESQAWHQKGSIWVQALTLAAVVGVLFLFSRAPVQVLAWAVMGFLGLETVNAFLVPPEDPAIVAGVPDDGNEHRSATEAWEQRPDIFLLVYESYANLETMLAYGYDNSEQVELLEEHGFQIYHGTYSVAGSSLATMSRVLEASSSLDREMTSITAGDSYTTRTLSSQGYETSGVFYSDYLYGTYRPSYDVNFPGTSTPWRPMATSILRGEFRASESFNATPYEDYLVAKREILASPGPQPRFMYSHNKYPGHSQNSGRCRPDEADRYFESVEVANEEMRRDVEAVHMSDRDAIVIVAADHGPYLTKNCTLLDGSYDAEDVDRLDLQDRYGTFLAIRWPESLQVGERVIVLQDVFPLLFAELSDDQSVWEERRVQPVTQDPKRTSGVTVENGVIHGGANDGEPLFAGHSTGAGAAGP